MNIPKILIIEDEPKVASFIKKGLEENQYEAKIAFDGAIGIRMALKEEYDVIILDINLPIINGYEVCRQVRLNMPNLPILMLTALGDTEDKLTGFDSGADDYLVKPFEFRELLARIKVLLKRNSIGNSTGNTLHIADLELNTDTKTVKRNNVRIELTAKEFTLLEYFLRNRGRVISRSELAAKIWEITFDTGTNVIDVYINFLRKKIDKDHSNKLIHTQIGMGYVLKESE
ncbi:MAG: response regulator transcription factor [Bacteroidetes bacterium]|nr:response regulator transcription factor [Bacteroidota bacterium]